MSAASDRQKFNERPSIELETNWVRLQLRVVFRLLQLHHQRNPLMRDNPNHYLNQISNSFMYIPSAGMLAFWFIALRNRQPDTTIMGRLLEMYAQAEDGVTFRRVAFPGYKQSRSYAPRGQGKRL